MQAIQCLLSASSAATDMTHLQSIIIGIVEGLTEYLPVSSTGHILLAQRAMGLSQNATNDAFAICVQGGAIVAVLGLYFQRVKAIVLGLWRGLREKNFGMSTPSMLKADPTASVTLEDKAARDAAVGRRLAYALLVAFIPALILGRLFDEKIEGLLMNLWPVAIAWLVGGVAILAVAWFRPGRSSGIGLERITLKMALIIGLLQCVAMCPGTSRSLMTMVGGLLVGLSLSAAVEFSFLLGVLTLGAATAYKALQHGSEMLEKFGTSVLVVGFLAAWVSAVLAVKWMVAFLQKGGFAVFGYYRVAIGLLVIALLAAGKISA